jgi:hypothetical protein
MPDRLSRLTEHIAGGKLDLLATAKQMLTILAWEGRQQ